MRMKPHAQARMITLAVCKPEPATFTIEKKRSVSAVFVGNKVALRLHYVQVFTNMYRAAINSG